MDKTAPVDRRSPDPSAAPNLARLGYNPALDGVRAIAIGMVLFFHAGFHERKYVLRGGWLGVDTFFVLSGFLITALLLEEFQRFRRVSLKNFYVRRMLRLLPLALLAVAGGFLMYLTRIPRGADAPTGKGLLAILFYVSNWVPQKELGPLAHFWSLSLEEQFYFVWPTVVVALLLLGGRRKILLLASGVGALIVAANRARIWHDAVSWAAQHPHPWAARSAHTVAANAHWYFGSFSRADGLFVGCFFAILLAWRPPIRSTLLKGTLALVALAAVVTGVLIVRRTPNTFPTFIAYWGLLAFNVCVALLIVHLVVSPTWLFARALSLRPVVWVGKRAYGIYVIHGVIYSLLPRDTLTAGSWLIVAVSSSLLVAAISYRFFEAPILALKSRFAAGGGKAPTPATVAAATR